jgi:hypothetical protein
MTSPPSRRVRLPAAAAVDRRGYADRRADDHPPRAPDRAAHGASRRRRRNLWRSPPGSPPTSRALRPPVALALIASGIGQGITRTGIRVAAAVDTKEQGNASTMTCAAPADQRRGLPRRPDRHRRLRHRGAARGDGLRTAVADGAGTAVYSVTASILRQALRPPWSRPPCRPCRAASRWPQAALLPHGPVSRHPHPGPERDRRLRPPTGELPAAAADVPAHARSHPFLARVCLHRRPMSVT